MTEPRTGPNLNRRTFLGASLAAGAVVSATGVLSACATGGNKSSGGASGAKSTTNPLGVKETAPLDVVIFDGGYGHDYANYDLGIYKKRYPKATTKMTATQQIQGQLQARYSNGTPPDVVDNSGAQLMDLGALEGAGALADLSDMFNAPSWDIEGQKVSDTLYPGVTDFAVLSTKPVVLQYVYTVFGFWHSQKLFEAKGWEEPKTWDDFRKLATQIKAAGISPFAYQGKYPYYIYEPLLTVAAKDGGNDLLKNIDNLEDGAWKVDSVVNAATAIQSLVKDKLLLPGTQGLTHTESQTQWCNGKAAFIPCGNWLENEMKQVTPSGFDMVVAPVPNLNTSGKMPFEGLHAQPGEGFIVSAKGKNVRGGLEFLRIMLSKDASRNFAQTNHALTVVKGTADDVQVGTALSSANAVVKAAGDNIISWRFADWYGTLGKSVEDATAKLMLNRSTPQQWAEACQKAADKVKNDPSIKKYHR
jgi:N-acetylglucosamine transport system substrate-binding protein